MWKLLWSQPVSSEPKRMPPGISKPEHVRAVAKHADAAIVGSALVRRMSEADDPVGAARDFVGSLAQALPV